MNRIKSLFTSEYRYRYADLPKEIRSTILKRLIFSVITIYLAITSIFALKSFLCCGLLFFAGCVMVLSTLLLAREFMMGKYLIIEGQITDKGQKKTGKCLLQLTIEDGTSYIVTVKQHDFNSIYVTNTVRLYVKDDTSLMNNIERLKINYPPFIFPVKTGTVKHDPAQTNESVQ